MSALGPTEALAAFDLADPEVVRDPYPVLEGLRSAGSPLWHDGLGLWLAARHPDADAVLRSRRLGRIFSPREPDDVWETFNWLHADSILDSEPPKHTRLRSLVAKAFARGHVERLRPRVHELAAQLLDGADPSGFDAIAAYAEPLPVMVVGELLGVPPEEQEPLRPWSQAIVKMYEYARTEEDEQRARTACAEFATYVVELADRRRSRPGDDLVTHLVQVEEAGERLTERELVATCVLLLNAGHEASVNGFGNGLVALLQRPDQWQQLVTESDSDSETVAATAVDEMLRYDSPLQLFERTATEDVEIGGVMVRHGQRIAALLGSANRDDTVFDRPDDFDVRRDANPHLAFGAGIHFCLGAPLARLELQITVPLLARRFPDLHLVGTPRLRPTFVLRGYETVDVAG